MRATIENLKQKPESYRHKVAFFTAFALTLVIFAGWATHRGFIGLPQGTVAYDEGGLADTASVAVSGNSGIQAASPLENSKNAFGAALSEFSDEWNSIKESISNVFVPFISGIEVYESK